MSKHTPGPWTLEIENRRGYIDAHADTPGDEPCIATLGILLSPQDHANAQLIAAAPGLLAACRAVVDAWESGDLAAAARQCDAAIIKATGG